MMQRSCSPFEPRSSTKPPGVGSCRPVPSRAFASAAARAAAAPVNAGMRPSAGSVTSDVRLVCTTVSPRSNQNWL